jgi:hypothetical protein
MKFSVSVMKTLFPQREKDRMEMRGCIARATAEAEDLLRTIEGDFNGHLKEISWEKFSATHSRSIPALCLPKKSQ